MVKREGIEYSVIVPVFNSFGLLTELFDRIKASFDEINKTCEVVFVNDASVDGSLLELESLKKQHPDQITVIDLVKNFGQHNATFCGLRYSNGKYIVTMDDDLQHPPEEIIKLIDKQEESKADLVYGIYIEKKHSAIRNAGSNALQKSSKLVLKWSGKGSSFRLITREIVDKMLTHYQRTVVIDELILWYTGNIAFAEVDHHSSKNKKSRYSFFGLFMLSLKILFYSSVIPLKIMIYGGFSASLVSFGIGLYHIYRKIFFKVPIGYTSIIVAVLFSTGILLFSLGIIGEYLRRVYEVQNKKTPYLIKKIF